MLNVVGRLSLIPVILVLIAGYAAANYFCASLLLHVMTMLLETEKLA